MQYWLFKSEPDSYSFEHLKRDGRTAWSGVRNYQARNFMKAMKIGDLGFFYHSSTQPPGIVGLCRVVREAYPDMTALDPAGDSYDPRATAEQPIWEMVDVAFERPLMRYLPLDTLRAQTELAAMPLLQRGSRLSIQLVTEAQWKLIIAIGG